MSESPSMSEKMSTHQATEDQRNEEILIYLNGKIVPKVEATVSVYDSGFMLGDGVWEGLRLHEGKIAFLDAHLQRLYQGAKAIDITLRSKCCLQRLHLANNNIKDAGEGAGCSAPRLYEGLLLS